MVEIIIFIIVITIIASSIAVTSDKNKEKKINEIAEANIKKFEEEKSVLEQELAREVRRHKEIEEYELTASEVKKMLYNEYESADLKDMVRNGKISAYIKGTTYRYSLAEMKILEHIKILELDITNAYSDAKYLVTGRHY